MVKTNYIKSITVTHADNISCIDKENKTKEFSNALEGTTEAVAPSHVQNCQKCRFHDAAYSDKKLGCICVKCRQWFAESATA
jgi:hypothetical protein